MKKTLYLVAGARPNFMKIAPIVRALQARPDVFDWRIVHDPATLAGIAGALRDISAKLPLVFPVHPRTRGNLGKFGLDLGPNVVLTKPLSYMDFLNLWKDASLILTDSGGLQEETTALGIACVTLRENTERPITAEQGTNTIVGRNRGLILSLVEETLRTGGKRGRVPELWDGHAAERIAAHLAGWLAERKVSAGA